MAFGLDYTTSPPVKAMKDIGTRFVCRYLSTPGNPKNLTGREAHELRTHGIAVVFVFETTAARALDGFPAGLADGRSAHAQAVACGAPKNIPVYFTVDFDPAPTQFRQVAKYFLGVNLAIGVARTGVYGGRAVVKTILDSRRARFAWQTYAWSKGAWDPRAQIQQYDNGRRFMGTTVDFNRATTREFGQWKPVSLPKRIIYRLRYRHGVPYTEPK
ncbi:MAG: DUF1906 domain-containing protein [Sulfuricaulis sp.]